ncbi:MAG: DUF1287 domain-containing protein [Chloroflexi bacterium]|nr:DUF1287 domain-containing protein [Chloroflexota bacterium]
MKPWSNCIVTFLFIVSVACAPSPTVTPSPTIPPPTLTPIPYNTVVAKISSRGGVTPPLQDLGTRIAIAAEAQVGVTTIYDSAYVRLDYPNGDVPIERGVCTDVVVRAFRVVGIDLQTRVHEDMKKNFAAYPKDWSLTKPDANIDHRRVQNLATYFTRMGKRIGADDDDEKFKPGDVVAWQLSGWMQHIGIVSAEKIEGTDRYYIIHNIGSGTHKEDALRWFKIIGHYRW